MNALLLQMVWHGMANNGAAEMNTLSIETQSSSAILQEIHTKDLLADYLILQYSTFHIDHTSLFKMTRNLSIYPRAMFLPTQLLSICSADDAISNQKKLIPFNF